MKIRLVRYVLATLILGLVLSVVSCGGTTTPSTPVTPAAPTAPVTPTEAPPTIPHTLEGRADCLVCHGEGALKPFPADHAGRTPPACTTCHQTAG